MNIFDRIMSAYDRIKNTLDGIMPETNILDRILPLRKGDEVSIHYENGSLRTYSMRGYMVGCEDGWVPVLYAKLTDTFGDTYITPYKKLVQSIREMGC